MKEILQRAKELKEHVIADRRHLHANPEVGMELPRTVDFIMKRLTEMGYEPQKCGVAGVTATVGKGGKTILLRADMDALPMEEHSGLEFASKVACMAHTCGHDCHSAMLLTAAKILKEREAQLEGTVKLMFQPGEEVFRGAGDMIAAGILKNPDVDAALGMHVFPAYDVGFVGYRKKELMASVDGFEITINGVGCHGAQPFNGVDPINIGAHLHIALQELIAREIDANEMALLTIGKFASGDAANIIPQTAVMQGTIRTLSETTRQFLVGRMKEVTDLVARTFRGTADIKMLSEIPVNFCNEVMVDEHLATINSMFTAGELNIQEIKPLQGSEDFALVSQAVPSAYLIVGAGFPGTDKVRAVHNPKVEFNEEALPIGAAIFAGCAENWLKNNK